MPLAEAAAGDTVRVVRVDARAGSGTGAGELIALGISAGRMFPVVEHLPGGGVLLDMDGRQFAIGGNAAAAIWVRLVDA